MTQIIEETQLDYQDVMIKPKRSTLNSRGEPFVYRDYKFKHNSRRLLANGFMVSNMATIGTFEMADVMANNLMFCCLHKHYTLEELTDFYNTHNVERQIEITSYKMPKSIVTLNPLEYIFISTGLRDEDKDKTFDLLDLGYKNLCIDIANGYIPNLLDYVKAIRRQYPEITIMVGNVVTGDMVQDLILNGADIVKVGIGPGANCITRKQTGVGRPQFSAVLDCAEAAHAVDGMICADGGITCVGDICKAYGAGADFVMVGSMVAGTTEADGDVITKVYKTDEVQPKDNTVLEDLTSLKPDDFPTPIFKINKYKLAYGMSSKYAQDKHNGGMKSYRASEGIVTLKPYIGSVQNVIDEYLGGLRSCMTYINCRMLKHFPKVCSFYRVNHILNNDGKGI